MSSDFKSDAHLSTQTNATKPRLMISKIVMENFKSYGGRQEIGPFHKSFSAVIGPNGSGKSNVIDALLFVFGRRARDIRLKKLSELVHNSAAMPNCHQCVVEVHFVDIYDDPNDEDLYHVVPNTQFIIKRTANTSSQSHYYIDNRQVSQSDVITKLKGKGVDLDNNRFLILQGEVEQIAMMKPVRDKDSNEPSLVDYLEDIIGTDKYVPEIQRSGITLDTLTEQRNYKNQILERAQKQCTELRKYFDQSLEYYKVEFQLAQLTYLREKVVWFGSQQNRGQVNNELLKHYNQLLEFYHTNKQLQQKLDEIDQDYQQKKQQYNSHTTRVEECQLLFTQYDSQYNKLVTEMTQLGQFQAQHQARVAKYQEQLRTYEGQLEADKSRLPSLKDEIESKTTQRTELNEQLNTKIQQISQLTEPLQKKLAELDKQKEPIAREVNIKQSERNKVQQEITTLQQRIQHSAVNKTQTQQELSASQDQLKIKQDESNTIQKEMQDLENMRVTKTKTLQEIGPRLKALRDERGDLQMKLGGLSNTQNSVRSTNRIVNSLLDEKQRNPTFQGVYGKLGELAWIDPKYDAAISSASGELNNIVVDTTATAEACIRYLRENNLGRATFLCVDKITQRVGQNLQRPFEAPSQSSRLYDLIHHVDDTFRPLFYNALGDTLVTETLEKAMELAQRTNGPRFRVTTIKGEVLAPTGAMTGGGEPFRGFMATSRDQCGASATNSRNAQSQQQQQNDAEEIRRAEQRLHAISLEVNQLETLNAQSIGELKAIADDIGRKKRYGANIEQEIKTLQEKIGILERDLDHIHQHEQTLPQLRQEITKKEQLLQSIDDGMSEIIKENNEIDTRVTHLKQQIMAQGGVDIHRLKQQDIALEQELDDLAKEQRRIETTLANFDARTARLRQQLSDSQTHVENSLKELEEKKVLSEDIENKAAEVLTEMEPLEEALRAIRELIQQYEERRDVYVRQMAENKRGIEKFAAKIHEFIDEENQLYKTSLRCAKMLSATVKQATDAINQVLLAQELPDELAVEREVMKHRLEDFIQRHLSIKKAEYSKKRSEGDEQLEDYNEDMIIHQARELFQQANPPHVETDEEKQERLDRINAHQTKIMDQYFWFDLSLDFLLENVRTYDSNQQRVMIGLIKPDVNPPFASPSEAVIPETHPSELARTITENLDALARGVEPAQLKPLAEDVIETKQEEGTTTTTSTSDRMGDDDDDDDQEESRIDQEMEDDDDDTARRNKKSKGSHQSKTNQKHGEQKKPQYTNEFQQYLPLRLEYIVNFFSRQFDRHQDAKASLQLHDDAIPNYKAKLFDYEVRRAEVATITAERDQVKDYHEGLKTTRTREFLDGLRIISGKLKDMYRMLTIGGDAELELNDVTDPFSEGINFTVRPFKKSWKQIQNLSGGEKTLSSLALVFALHYYKPTPLYVMDEIDAALDFKNVSIVANYIKDRTKNAQFIVISLRNNMFELSHRLVGIYKTNDMTKSLTIDPRSYAPAQHQKQAIKQNESEQEKNTTASQMAD